MEKIKEHRATEGRKKQVETMTACGATNGEIAKMLDIEVATLVKHYRRELETAGVKANIAVAQKLYTKAMGGCFRSMELWLRSRAQWREVVRNEHLDIAPTIIHDDIPRTEFDKLTTTVFEMASDTEH